MEKKGNLHRVYKRIKVVYSRYMDTPDTFSRVMFVDECLLDEERTRAFELAIKNKVKEGDVVMDAGTGSGIMALIAARAGAKKVYAIEIDSEVLALAENSLKSNKEGDHIQLVKEDLTKLQLAEKMDVVIMELMDTGLINEQQAYALNALRENNIIDEKTKLIPEAAVCALELIDYDFSFYDFAMPMIIQARNGGCLKRVKTKLSETVSYRDIDFSKHVDTSVNEERNVVIKDDGTLNAVLLRTKIVLDKDDVLWETSDMNMPVVVPVKPIQVKKGDVIKTSIAYKMGLGFDQFSASVEVVK